MSPAEELEHLKLYLGTQVLKNIRSGKVQGGLLIIGCRRTSPCAPNGRRVNWILLHGSHFVASQHELLRCELFTNIVGTLRMT